MTNNETQANLKILSAPVLILLVITSYLSMIPASLSETIRSPLYSTFMAEFSLTHSDAAVIFWVAALCMIVGSLAVRRLADWSSQKLHLLGMSIIFLSNISAALVSTFPALVASFGFASFGYGIVNVTHNVLIEQGSPVRRRRTYLFGLHAVYGMAAGVAPLIFAAFAWLKIGNLRSALFVVSAMCIPSLILCLRCPQVPMKPISTDEGDSKIHGKYSTLIFGALFGTYVASEILIATRLPVVSEKVFGYTAAEAGLFLTGFYVLFVSGRLFMAFANPSWDLKKFLPLAMIATAILMVCGAYISPYLLMFCGLTISPLFPGLVEYGMHVYRESFAPRFSVVATGVGIALAIMNFAAGWVSDHLGLRSTMTMAAVFMLASLISMTIFKRTQPH